MYQCKSGQHWWLGQEDAGKCCNGYRRVLLLGQDLQPTDKRAGELPGPTLYGFGRAPIGEASTTRPGSHDSSEQLLSRGMGLPGGAEARCMRYNRRLSAWKNMGKATL